MSKNKITFDAVIKKLRYRTVEFNIEYYQSFINKIANIELGSCSDSELKQLSRKLIEQSKCGTPLSDLLLESCALVREASSRVLGMCPFDVQIMAGISMHEGNLVEMQTGEGKTLAAVFPAYLNALSGKGVFILTFNDYLAQRDAEWMGPLYRFLGLTVGYVREGMSEEERRKAYSSDITYLTAKEAGFDYLKGFLCSNKEELIQRPFNFAIVDEADSILIDEARIPLVIAGNTHETINQAKRMNAVVKQLIANIDYETDKYSRNVYLTDTGISKAENILKCGNLYDTENINLLAAISNALHAETFLKRDIDYIIRNNKIELVDEFTGRIADKRQWPYGLQEAIEAKEGITPINKGQILASIAIRDFICLFPKICGMTGTALTSADEFFDLYGLKVVVIPTNKPCIRRDYPDVIFTHKEAKLKALISEITKVHKTGRPILVGTLNVEESEKLNSLLQQAGVKCRVLNAKNNYLEAQIISQAGALGAVTVSTNMAGRGTDIKLGGEQEQDYEKVASQGGLYVIGTNRHESRRIDNQLRGRAGRQGDPGSSRFFTSLEDDLLKKYRIEELIPSNLLSKKQDEEIQSQIVTSQVARAQRIIEGQNFEIRKTLNKYSIILEQQRQIIFKMRQDILFDKSVPRLMPEKLSERYAELSLQLGAEPLKRAENQVLLHFINKCWADYLDYMSYIRASIHLVNLAGKVPVFEYNKIAVEAFEEMLKDIENQVISTLVSVEITQDGIDMNKEGLKSPSSTWTYLINDDTEKLGINLMGLNQIAAAVSMPLLVTTSFIQRFFRKNKKSAFHS